VRLIFNGAEPISVELCEEFLNRLRRETAPRGDVPRLWTRGSLARGELCAGRRRRGINQPESASHDGGTPAQFLTRAAADAVTVVSVGRAIPYCRLR